MFDNIKPFHVLVTLVVLVATTTAAAVLFMTPMTYAKETRQMVVELDLKEQLYYYQKVARETRRECMDLRTKEWLCSDEDFGEYESMLLEIQLLKAKLGIDKIGG